MRVVMDKEKVSRVYMVIMVKVGVVMVVVMLVAVVTVMVDFEKVEIGFAK